MSLKDKRIGIWGFGIVGKSLINYCIRSSYQHVAVFDQRVLNAQEIAFLSDNAITYFNPEQHDAFLQWSDRIIPSPGIDLRPYKQYEHKWYSELDIFAYEWSKPCIAITGTVGKTSVTIILSYVLEKHYGVIATGGNIGKGVVDLVFEQDRTALAVIEVSSFQLERTQYFAPSLAIITNFYPNHLDRHGSEHEYFTAKLQSILHQNDNQHALVPLTLLPLLYNYDQLHNRTFYFFTTTCFDAHNTLFTQLRSSDSVFYCDTQGSLYKWYQGTITLVIAADQIPQFSYQENWVITAAVLDILKLPVLQLLAHAEDIQLPEHRLQKIATIGTIDFYNDSKSTVPESTLAAVNKLKGRPVILLLGGISKGVDRASCIARLDKHVRTIVCFGAEAKQIALLAECHGFPSSIHETLEDAVAYAVALAHVGDQIVLSPGGASYDLFRDYKERGERFCTLVATLQNTILV